MVDHAFLKQLEGYGLATADILYRLPDHPKILQNFVWQTYDLAPDFPEIKKFLSFWSRSLDGAIHSVRIAHHHLIRPAELRLVGTEFTLH